MRVQRRDEDAGVSSGQAGGGIVDRPAGTAIRSASTLARSARFLIAFVLITGSLFPLFGATTTKTWVGATSGNWNNASNWSPSGVPDDTNDVFINASGSSFTVTLDTNTTIASLTLGTTSGLSTQTLTTGAFQITTTTATGGTGGITVNLQGRLQSAGTLNVAGPFDMKNGSITDFQGTTISGAGTVNINTGGTANVTGFTTFSGKGVTNNGLLAVTATLHLDSGTSVSNSGEIDLSNSASIGTAAGSATIANSGTIEMSGGTSSSISIATLNNNSGGTIRAAGGIFNINANGSSVGGTWEATSGNTLRFPLGVGKTQSLDNSSSIIGAGTIEYASGSLSSTGTYNVTGTTATTGGAATISGTITSLGNTLSIGSGQFTLNYASPVTVDHLTFSNGGTLEIANTLAISNSSVAPLTWGFGTLKGTGTLVVPSARTITVDNSLYIDNATLQNGGLIKLDGGLGFAQLGLDNGGDIVNQSGATIRFVGQTGAINDLDDGGSLTNQGLIEQTHATGTSTVTVDTINQGGSFEADSGVLILSANSSSTGGSFTVASGAKLNFGGGAGDWSTDASTSISGAGTVEFQAFPFSHAGTYNVTGTTRQLNANSTLSGTVTSVGTTLEITAGTLNISSTGALTVDTLTFNSGGTLQIAGNLTIDDSPGLAQTWTSGTLKGTGTLFIPSTVTVSLNQFFVLDGATIANSGTINFDSSNTFIGVSHDGTIVNSAGAVIDLQEDNNGILHSAGTVGTLENHGTVKHSGTSVSAGIGIHIENVGGTIQQLGGTLTLDANVTALGGTITVASGSTLRFGSGTGTVSLNNASSLSGAGAVEIYSVSFTSSGTYNITGSTRVLAGTNTIEGTVTAIGSSLQSEGGTLTLNSGSTFTLTTLSFSNGGEIGGTASLIVTGASQYWQSGKLSGTGTITLNAGVVTDIAAGFVLDERTLSNAGTIRLNNAGSLVVQNDAEVQNSGTIDFQVDAIIGNGGTNGTITNTGLITKSGGAFTSVIGTVLENDSAYPSGVKVESGSLLIGGGGSSTGGGFTIGSGAELQIGGNGYSADSASRFTGSGKLLLNGTLTSEGIFEITGDLDVNSGSSDISGTVTSIGDDVTLNGGGFLTLTNSSPVSVSTLNVNGGTIDGSGTINITGTTMSWSSGGIQGTGTINIGSSSIVNAPLTFLIVDSRNITNDGTFNHTGTGTIMLSGSQFENNGTFNATGGGSISTDGGTFLNDGTFNNEVTGFGPSDQAPGGRLRATTHAGGSTFVGPAFTNSATGTVHAKKGGIIFQGGLTQSGTLSFDINGVGDFGSIFVDSPLTLDGHLSATTTGAYTPAAGQTFKIIGAQSFTGAFDTTALTYASDVFEPFVESNAYTLVATAETCLTAPGDTISYYRGEDETDSEGSNDGTVAGGVTFVAGKVGDAITLDGTSGYLTIPNDASLQPTSFTIEGWVEFNANTTFYSIVSKRVGSSTLNSYALHYNYGSLQGVIGNASGTTVVSGPFTPTIGNWYHVALTYDDATTTAVLYVNGSALSTEGQVLNAPEYDTNPVLIGAEDDLGIAAFFPGAIDELAIYSRALSPAEIQMIFGADEYGRCFAGPPTITALSPTSGTTAGGTTVTITGDNLINVTSVTFGGTAGNITGTTAGSLTVQTPAHAAGVVDVVVTSPGGSATETNGFTFVTNPIYWTGQTDNSWHVNTNWDPNTVPTSTDTAIINSGGATVVITSAADAGSVMVGSSNTLSMTGGSLTIHSGVSQIFGTFSQSGGSMAGTGTLAIRSGGTYNWSGGSLINNTAALAIDSGATATISGSAARTLQRNVTNEGTVTFTATGQIQHDNSNFSNFAGGVFSLQSDALWSNAGGTPTFSNAGTFHKSGGSGTATFGVPITNSATGTMTLSSGSTIVSAAFGHNNTTAASFDLTTGGFTASGGGTSSGAFQLGAGTTFDITSSTFNLSAGSSFTGSGLVNVSGGTLSVNGSASINKLSVTGGTVTGGGTLTVHTNFSWTHGPLLNNTGTLALASGSTSTISGGLARSLQRLVTNAGTVTFTATGQIQQDNASFTNLSGGTFDLQSDALWSNTGGVPSFVNNGTFNKTGGTGTATFGVPFSSSSTGTMTLSSGNMTVSGTFAHNNTGANSFNLTSGNFTSSGGGTSAGTFNLGSGTTFGITTSTFNLSAGASFTGSGVASVSSGTLSVNGNSSMNKLAVVGGTLTGGGTLTVNTDFSWTHGPISDNTGTLALASGSSSAISGALARSLQRNVTNAGTLTFTATGQIQHDNASFTNLSDGTFDLQSDANWTNSGGTPSFTNNGAFIKTGGAGTATFGVPVTNSNTGTMALSSGNMAVSGAFGHNNTAANSFNITTGIFTASGGGTSPGTLNIGSGAFFDVTSNTYNLSDGAAFTGAGVLKVAGGTLSVNANASANNVGLLSGAIAGAGALTVNGAFSWTGGGLTNNSGSLVLASTSTSSITGATARALQRNVVNHGTMTFGATGQIQHDNSTFTNSDTGIIDVTSNANWANSGGTPQIVNEGLFKRTTTTANAIFAPAFNNSDGTIEVVIGTMNVLGTFTQDGTSELKFGIGGGTAGTGYGRLDVSGAAPLANATLTAYTANGFVPGGGQQFSPFTFGSRTGTFGTKNLTFGGTRSFTDTLNVTSLLLTADGPTISTVTPNTGGTAGGTTVVISGTGFTNTPANVGVLFGTTGAASVTFDSSTQLTVVTPAHAAGSVDVKVTNGDGIETTKSNAFTFGSAPVITTFDPASGEPGTVVTIDGSNFTGATAVSFNGTAASFTVQSDSDLTAVVPLGATTGPISITNPDGTGTSGTNFTVLSASCEPLPANAMAWYRFEGNANDALGTSNGTTAGGAAFAAGRVGQALTLNGSSDYVTVPDSATIQPATALTIEGWVKFSSVPSYAVLFSKPLGGGNDNSYAIYYALGQLGGGTTPIATAITAAWSPVAGTWYHVAYTWDGTTQKLFINGSQVASGAHSATLSYDSHPLLIGAENESGSLMHYMPGQLDEFALYSRALSSTEVSNIYFANGAGKCACLQPAASNDGPYCEGQTIQLTAATIDGATYSWTGPGGFTSSLQNPTITNATLVMNGTYSVTATVSGCTSLAGTTTVVVNDTPLAPIASNGGPYCEGQTIQLNAFVGAPDQLVRVNAVEIYSWTGPNGFTSSDQNPVIPGATAADAGTYNVTVTINGCTSPPAQTTVVVNATPATPTASNDGPYCEGATINLSTPAVAGATYSWTGPDGFTSSVQNPSITNATLAMAGTYNVTVTVNGCTSAAGSTNVVVNATPPPPAASNGGPYCEGQTIQLNAFVGAPDQLVRVNAVEIYSWTGPNGFTSSDQNPVIPGATAADAGTYNVTVTVNGCTSAAGSTTVVVNTTPATPSPSNGGPYCEGATINLSTPAVAGATYSWTGPDGFTSSVQNPSITNATLAMAGTYNVTVTVNGCTSAAGSTNVVVNATPATPTASNGGPYCEGATINLSTPAVAGATYSWTGPDGFTSSVQNPSITNATLAMAGTYNVTVTVNGCTSAAGSTNVVVHATPATPTASNGGPYCEGSTISLSTSTVAGATYAWTGPNGFTSSLQNPTLSGATLAMAGTYNVTIAVNGCTSAAGSTTVAVNAAPPAPTASNSGPYCEGSTIVLTATTVAGATYSWAGPNGFTSTLQNPSITGAAAAHSGTYAVTAMVNGCPSPAGETAVTVSATPTPAISGPATSCPAAAVTLDAGAGYSSYLWSTGETTRTIVVTPGVTTTYNVTVTNGSGCAASDSHVVTISMAEPVITAPDTVCTGSTNNASTQTQAGATYVWSIVNGTINTGQGSAAITFTASGTAPVTLGVAVTVGSCTVNASKQVVVGNQETVVITGPNSFCDGGSVTLDAGPGFASYLWSTGQTTRTITVSPTGTATYSVTVTQAGGCSRSGQKTVVRVPPPDATITAPSTLTAGTDAAAWVPFAASTSYDWSASTGVLILSGANSRAITFRADNSTTTAVLRVTVDNGSCSSVGTANVTIQPASCPTATPTLQSPAGNAEVSSPVAFSWTAVEGATGYLLRIVSDAGAQTSQNTPSTSASVALSTGNYSWTVTALFANDCQTVSSTGAFRVRGGDNCPADRPSAIAPAAGATVESPVTFTWTGVANAIGYRVFVSTAGSPPADLGLTTATTLTAAVPPGANDWFVEAIFSGCPATRSDVTRFNIPRPDPCTARAASTPLAPATGQQQTSGFIDFSWTAVPGASGYRVWISVANAAYAVVAGTTTETSARERIPPGQAEWYVETLFEGCASVESAHRTFSILPAPICGELTPTLLSPAHEANVTTGSVTFSWAPLTGATNYELWLAHDGGDPTLLLSTASTSVTIPIPPGALEWFVRADIDGCPSKDSAKRIVRYAKPASCPEVVPVAASPVDGLQVVSGLPITFTWSAVPGATSYKIEFGDGSSSTVPATTATHTYSTTGTMNWKVEANVAGCSGLVGAARTLRVNAPAPPCSVPTAPALLAPGQVSSNVPFTVRWTAPAPNLSYTLQEWTNPDGSGALSLSTVNTEMSRTHANTTTAPIIYRYRVRAVSNCAGVAAGPYSDPLLVTILPSQPVGRQIDSAAPVDEAKTITYTIPLDASLAGLAFSAVPNQSWLTVVPSSGVVPPGGMTLTVTANTAGLALGTNLGGITITTAAGADSGDARTNLVPTAVTTTTVSVSLVQPVLVSPKTTPPPDALIIPAVAHAFGINSKFVSDVRISNTSAQVLKYQLTFTPSGESGIKEGKQATIDVSPGKTVALDDVLATWFGASDSGAIGTLEVRPLTPTAPSISSVLAAGLQNLTTFASSRTFNVTPNGTLGQYIPAIPFANFVGAANALNPSKSSILSLQQIAQSDAYRTNLGIVEGSGNPASVLVSVFGGNGSKVTEFNVNLTGGQHLQMNSFLAERGLQVEDGRVEVKVLSPTGKVTAYASVLDNKTNDPLLVNPVPLSEQGNNKYVLPGVADLNNGFANWQTDMRVFNASDESVEATLSFHSVNGGEPRTSTITLAPNEVKQLDSTLNSVFGVTNDGGAVHVSTAENSNLIVTGRTYNEATVGTYGQFISAVTPADAATFGSRPLQLLQVEESDRYRSNVGIAEVTGKPVTVQVSVVPVDSRVTASITLDLGANEFRQFNGLLKQLGMETAYNARVTVKVVGGEGRVTAYASVIDQLTQDPTYVPAQ